MSEKARLSVAVEAISDCLRSDGALRPQDGLDLAKRIREAFEDAHKNGKAHPVACDTAQVTQ